MKYQGHYGLEFALRNSDTTIEETVKKLEQKQNRNASKIIIRERDLPALNLQQKAKDIRRKLSIEKRRQQYMKGGY